MEWRQLVAGQINPLGSFPCDIFWRSGSIPRNRWGLLGGVTLVAAFCWSRCTVTICSMNVKPKR